MASASAVSPNDATISEFDVAGVTPTKCDLVDFELSDAIGLAGKIKSASSIVWLSAS